jgi:hypothetical protein
MNQQVVAEGIVAWVVATCSPAVIGSYAYLPEEKPDPLPDVVVDLLSRKTAVSDPLFPMQQIQQRWLRIWMAEVSIMVDNSDREAAAEQLNDYADQLEASAMKDGTLGGRVPFISPYFSFDLSHPFVEWEGGTRGREMTMTLAVGELVEAPE